MNESPNIYIYIYFKKNFYIIWLVLTLNFLFVFCTSMKMCLDNVTLFEHLLFFKNIKEKKKAKEKTYYSKLLSLRKKFKNTVKRKSHIFKIKK